MARMSRIAGGVLLLIAGTIMLVVPGPGIMTIGAGVLVLAKDVPAAERVVEWVRPKLDRKTRPGTPNR